MNTKRLMILIAIAGSLIGGACALQSTQEQKMLAAQEADFVADVGKQGFTGPFELSREFRDQSDILILAVNLKGEHCTTTLRLERVPGLLFFYEFDGTDKIEDFVLTQVLINGRWEKAEARGLFMIEPPRNPTPAVVDAFLVKYKPFKQLCK